jgi:hypothetical protein
MTVARRASELLSQDGNHLMKKEVGKAFNALPRAQCAAIEAVQHGKDLAKASTTTCTYYLRLHYRWQSYRFNMLDFSV